jgi:glucose-1-phosphate thymidylyltransferase
MPKALIPVAGKPMIEHILDRLRGLKPSEVSLVVGFLGDKIVDYLGDESSLPLRFYYQREMLGLGHAIWQVLKEVDDGDALIVLGDSILDVDYDSAVKSKETVIGVREVDDPRRFGVVIVHDDGYIHRLVEKPDEPVSRLAIAGLYYFPSVHGLREALGTLIEKDIRTKGEYQLTDALQILIDKGENMRPFTIDGWYDCGKPETLLETQRLLLDKEGGTHQVLDGSIVRPPVAISERAAISGSVIGPYVSVDAGATIRDSVISDSVVFRGAEVEGCRLSASLIGIDAKVQDYNGSVNVGQKAEVLPYRDGA